MSSTKPPQVLKNQALAKQLEVLARELRRALLKLNREIGAYPSPIPACDAQFNYLLEKRRRLARHDRQVQRMMAQEARQGVVRGDVEALVERLERHNDLPVGRLHAIIDEIR